MQDYNFEVFVNAPIMPNVKFIPLNSLIFEWIIMPRLPRYMTTTLPYRHASRMLQLADEGKQ